jgi:Zn-dependent alcohol dehydrogenase
MIGRKGCARSKDGEEIWARFFGQSSFSGYSVVAESSIVNAKSLRVSDDELKLFAPLGCGLQTGMGAIENVAEAGLNDVVVILGLGGVGLASLMVRNGPFAVLVYDI